MTERYGSGDEGQRPSGRGAVAERLARESSGAREIDLTDEAVAREAGNDQADRESSGAFEPAPPTADPPAADTRPGSSNIFDVDERDKQEEDAQSTGYEPPADADATPAEAAAEEREEPEEPEAASEEPEDREEPEEPEAAAEEPEELEDITPTPVPVAEPPADTPAPHGLPEPATASDTPAAGEPPAATAAAGTAGSLLEPLDAGELRNRFLDIQAGFVDEPRQAVEEAGRFVDDLVRQVADAIQQQRGQLAGATPEGSTEDLRLALRAYRQFVDRLLGMVG
jgi:hypothetical protein